MRACVRVLPPTLPTREAGIPHEQQEEGRDASSVCFGCRAPEANPPAARRGDGKRRRVAFGNSNVLCRVASLPRRGALLNRGVWRRGKVTTGATAVQPISISQRSLLLLLLRLLSPLVHHRRHCQPTVGSSVLPSLQARRVYPPTPTHTTLKPPPPPQTKLGVAQTQQQRWITVCGSASIFEATGLREAVILVKQLQDSLSPPMRALSLFAVASFTLLIKPLSERVQRCLRVCQVPTSVCCWQPGYFL